MISTVGKCVIGVAAGVLGATSIGVVGGMVERSAINSQGRTNASQIETTVKKPEIVTVTEKETEIIPYGSETIDDNTLASGTTVVRVAGVAGERTKTYSVTYTDGVESSRNLVADEVTTEPATEIIARGTYVHVVPQATTSNTNSAAFTSSPASNCPNGTYTNSAGNVVCRPSTTQSSGATAVCRDGTYSYSQSRSGTCSHHGGVAQWL